MMKRTQLILLFMLVLSGAVLLGTIPAGAQGTTNITGVRVDDGAIVTDLSGQTPINPCYNPTPSVTGSPCYPMVEATDLWICNGDPMPEGALPISLIADNLIIRPSVLHTIIGLPSGPQRDGLLVLVLPMPSVV